MTTATEELIGITDAARARVRAIFEKESPEPGTGLRLGVVGGGCSGLSYMIEFSRPEPTDRVVDCGEFEILIDPKSSIYLKGTTLDFSDGLQGKGFVFVNPNASNTCGCGESFSV